MCNNTSLFPASLLNPYFTPSEAACAKGLNSDWTVQHKQMEDIDVFIPCLEFYEHPDVNIFNFLNI